MKSPTKKTETPAPATASVENANQEASLEAQTPEVQVTTDDIHHYFT